MSLPSWDRIRSPGKLATITGAAGQRITAGGQRLQREMGTLQSALAGLHLEPGGLTEISKTQDIIQSKVRSFERLGEAMTLHADILSHRGSEAIPEAETKLEISRTAMDLKGAVTKLEDLSIFIDILQSELEVEAILRSRPDIDLKPLLTGIQDTVKQINESLAPLAPSQQHDRPIYLDSGIEFDRRLIETVGTNVIQLDARDNPLGEWTDTFHTISTLMAFNDLEPAVKHQLGHYLCHVFFTNAFYREDEIHRFGYQTTPLNLQNEGGYLRGEVTGITDAFKTTLIAASGSSLKLNEMALASSANFENVLGQLTKTVTAENRDQVATDIALKFMEGGGNLEEYPYLRSLVRIIVPFPSEGEDKWGRFESATRAAQTEFRELVLSKLQPILDASFAESYAPAKAVDRAAYDGQLAA